ncbi:hypothetical protein VNO80_08708 [Phaseolus coccineus]|uniref:Uncharacterized protein n=1 Tax=Phaseolus coccineus TaxID=3886 RepID=A0AAN9RBU2_PHACN
MCCLALLSVFLLENHNPNLSKVKTLESFAKLCGNNIIIANRLEELVLTIARVATSGGHFTKLPLKHYPINPPSHLPIKKITLKLFPCGRFRWTDLAF